MNQALRRDQATRIMFFVENRKEIDAVNRSRVVNILFSKNLRFTKAKQFFRGSLKAAEKFLENIFRCLKIFALVYWQGRENLNAKKKQENGAVVSNASNDPLENMKRS